MKTRLAPRLQTCARACWFQEGNGPKAPSSQKLLSAQQAICDQENLPLVLYFHTRLIPVTEEDIGKAYALRMEVNEALHCKWSLTFILGVRWSLNSCDRVILGEVMCSSEGAFCTPG